MKWCADTNRDGSISQYSIVSECRRYRISKASIAEGIVYTAWKGNKMLATRLPSKEAAEAVVMRAGRREQKEAI